jgi:hypothetical protein
MQAKEKANNVRVEKWGLALIAEVTERGWIVWVLKRMREAVEEKVCILQFRPRRILIVNIINSQNSGQSSKRASNA